MSLNGFLVHLIDEGGHRPASSLEHRLDIRHINGVGLSLWRWRGAGGRGEGEGKERGGVGEREREGDNNIMD